MPPDWLAFHDGALVGSTVPIPLDLEEMGLPEGMTAQVTGNEPCPAIDQGPGRVVLTTVNHLNPRVVELTLQVGAGGPTVPERGKDSTAGKNRSRSRSASGDLPLETVRPTAHHKFYSETRAQWLSAEDLQPGKHLRGLTGPLQVVSQRPIPGTHRVYNMTVEGEHVYHVSTLGVLAHNMCAKRAMSLAERRAMASARTATERAARSQRAAILRADRAVIDEEIVFWAGRGGANRAAAEGFASLRRIKTLGQTHAGQALDSSLDYSKMTVAEVRAAWTGISRNAALGQKGTVHAFAGGAGPDTIFRTVELPALMRNPNVKKIVIHDAVNTAKTRVIYPGR